MSVYIINGLLSGIAGLLLASRLSSANPSAAMGYELDAICSTVLGGTALTGGKGKIGGAFLGAIAISMLRNGMNIMGLRLVTQKMVVGTVLILILIVDVWRKGAKR
jgi:ribose transport system permease protein